MTFSVDVDDLDVHYGATRAIDGVSFSLAAGTIVGLLGRNGAGKSTLLTAIATFRPPTAGTIRIDGEDPYENRRVVRDVCLIREDGDLDGSLEVGEALDIAACLRPRWDQPFADRPLERFEVERTKRISSLSRGQRSAVSVTVGLATRAPLTMFDEPHLGMDAPSRYAFYEELLADYLAQPRTIILSTHLIDEVASLLEDVVILHRGRVLAHSPALELQSHGAMVTGPAADVDALTTGLSVLSQRMLGSTKSAVVYAELDDDVRRRAAELDVELGPIPLQDLFVNLTTKEEVAP